jgi:SAM-dependent methyltransferase
VTRRTVTHHTGTREAVTDVRVRIPVTQAEREPVAPMERLDFTLPDFTRVSWVSDDARAVWEPRLGRVTGAWLEIEWHAVLARVRRCAIATSSPESLPALGRTWAEHGLSAVPVEMIGVNGQPYAATPVAVQAGGPFAYRLVVGHVDDVAAFGRAWEIGDDTAIGELLGYPACCRDFFRRTWVDEGMVDTTWPMAAASGRVESRFVEVTGPPVANILWRWVGARAVPHLPCRTDCEATVAFGEALLTVGREAGFAEEMGWLEEVLSWPVEWSALHGIAEIKTPVLRVSTRTDATPVRYTVRRRGTGFPAEGTRGLAPPYEAPVKLLMTETRGYQRGIDHGAEPQVIHDDWYHLDNGFSSRLGMRDAHRPVVAAAAAALDGERGRVLDLGCGNGALLAALGEAVRGLDLCGVEQDPTKVTHAARVLPEHAHQVIAANMFDDDLWRDGERYALAFVMPGRLLEVDDDAAAARLRANLGAHCDRIILYAYGDWLTSAGDLASLARDAGFTLLDRAAEHAGLAIVTQSAASGDDSQEMPDGP